MAGRYGAMTLNRVIVGVKPSSGRGQEMTHDAASRELIIDTITARQALYSYDLSIRTINPGPGPWPLKRSPEVCV